jgi:hypothetical protein
MLVFTSPATMIVYPTIVFQQALVGPVSKQMLAFTILHERRDPMRGSILLSRAVSGDIG